MYLSDFLLFISPSPFSSTHSSIRRNLHKRPVLLDGSQAPGKAPVNNIDFKKCSKNRVELYVTLANISIVFFTI